MEGLSDNSSTSFSVEVQPRVGFGRSVNNAFRKTGWTPCVVYNKSEGSIPAAVVTKDFVKLAKKAKPSQVFHLTSKDSKLNGKSALVREIQKEPLSGSVLHIDFQWLKDDEQVTLNIPLKLVGEAYGVKTDGGILNIQAHEIKVACFPKNIPSEILVTITHLKIGENLHARDIQLPEGVQLRSHKDDPILSVQESDAQPVAADAAGAVAGADAAKAAEPAKKETAKK